jgi:hypothetical protein
MDSKCVEGEVYFTVFDLNAKKPFISLHIACARNLWGHKTIRSECFKWIEIAQNPAV